MSCSLVFTHEENTVLFQMSYCRKMGNNTPDYEKYKLHNQMARRHSKALCTEWNVKRTTLPQRQYPDNMASSG
jgi:hypothetical protein